MLPQATEALLEPIAKAVRRQRNPLREPARIALRAGNAVGKYKMAKHSESQIQSHQLRYVRKPELISAEAAINGL